MMDGYALRSAEIGGNGRFQIKIQIPAGSPQASLGSQASICAEIMTGAPVPGDADCVVPYEATERLDKSGMRLLSPDAHQRGDCIHLLGSDLERGATLLSPGCRIGGREIAAAASCGYAKFEVARPPSIAVISTGDELVDVSSAPEAHQIRRSNDLSIEAALTQQHLPVAKRAHLPDDPDISKARLEALIEQHDILIISGGISMGNRDFIPETLTALGLNGHFHGVAQKPGKPMGFWSHSNCAVFALPGNPSSTLTCLHHYVIPAILQAMGDTTPRIPRRVTLEAPVKARDDLTVFLPVQLLPDNRAHARPTQNSGDLVRILTSDGFIKVPITAEKAYPPGTLFDFHPWY
jgi:molybdopterin molybdotransferase